MKHTIPSKVDVLLSEPDEDVDTPGAQYVIPSQAATDQHVTYVPWTDGYAVGYKMTHQDGRVEYLYFNPSANPDGSDVPNVFVYQGEHGDPGRDGAEIHFLPFED